MAFTSAVDLYNAERQAASKATATVRSGVRSAISRTTDKRSGQALKAVGSRFVFKDNRLQRVTIKSNDYIFKQHYGFEGTKKNGVNMRLRATGVINLALQNTNVLETLADSIGEIRADQITAKINFPVNLNAEFKTRE